MTAPLHPGQGRGCRYLVPEPSSSPRTPQAMSLGTGLHVGVGTKGTSKGNGFLFSPAVHTCWADPPAKPTCMATAATAGGTGLRGSKEVAKEPQAGGRRCEESHGRWQEKGREVTRVCAPVLGLRQPELCAGEAAASRGSEAAIFASEY